MNEPARLPVSATAPTVAGPIPLNLNPELPGRAYFKWLATALILDKRLWIEFYDRCKAMASGNLYGHKNANTVAAAVLKGMSLGMDFMESLEKIKVIKGNPTLRGPNAVAHIQSVVEGAKLRPYTDKLERGGRQGELSGFPGMDRAELVQYLTTRHPDCWIDDRLDTSKIAVWVMARPDWEPTIYAFTMAQAEAAGLVDRNDNWRLYPDRCLKWQAASVGCQEMFNDVLAGMYLTEELENSPNKVVDVQAVEAPPVVVEPEPAELPAHVDPETYQTGLDTVGKRLREWGIAYATACQHCLGEQLGHARPSPEQLERLSQWLDGLDVARDELIAGGNVHGRVVRIYQADYERHRPVVEVDGPDGIKNAVWSGAARHVRSEATAQGGRAGVLLMLGAAPPEQGDDDEPIPEVVERVNTEAKAAVDEARADAAARNEAFAKTLVDGDVIAGEEKGSD